MGARAAPAAPPAPWWGRPTLVLPAAVGISFFVIGLVQLATTWYPNGDWAVAELVVRHTSRVVPLSGPYSARRGYDHPLPLVYAIQWLPYQLTGQRSSAGLATTVWWNGAWLCFLLWLLARAGATWLGVLALATVTAAAARTPSATLLLPWNPSLALVPTLVLVFVAWRVALGSRRLLPVLAFLAVWCAGAHLGFVPLVVPVAAVAVVGLVTTTVRRGGAGALTSLWRPAAIALAVSVTLVSPMLIDLARNGDTANPVRIVERGPLADSVPTVPRTEVAKVLRAELAIPPAWARTTPPFDLIFIQRSPRFPWAIVLGAGVVAAAWWRRAHDEVLGMGIALLGVVSATLGLSTIEASSLQPWYLLPAHAASMAFWALGLWSTGRSLRDLAHHRGVAVAPRPTVGATPARAALAPVTAIALVALLVPSLRTDGLTPATHDQVRVLAEAVAGELPPGSAVLLDGPIDVDGFYTAALALALDRAGFDVRVPDDQLFLFTPALAAPERWQPTTLLVQISAGPALPPAPGTRLLAETRIEPLLLTSADHLSLWVLEP
jgi:hypothetical protein